MEQIHKKWVVLAISRARAGEHDLSDSTQPEVLLETDSLLRANIYALWQSVRYSSKWIADGEPWVEHRDAYSSRDI